jgi:hypothetical protein
MAESEQSCHPDKRKMTTIPKGWWFFIVLKRQMRQLLKAKEQ